MEEAANPRAAPRRLEPPLLLGLDVGTSRIRGLAVDRHGQVAALASRPTPTEAPRAGWAEYDPETLRRLVLEVVREVVAAAPAGTPVAGLAVASMGEAGVAIDAAGRPVNRPLAWYCPRTAQEAAWIEETLGAQLLFEVTGITLDPILGLCKLLWWRRSAPAAFARAVRWLNLADWVTFELCGEAQTDFSLASRTLALDIRQGQWSGEILGRLGLDPSLFAPLAASGTPLGRIRPEIAAATGLSPETMVAVGAHDHVAGAIAAGAVEPGILLDSMGTAEALFLPTDRAIIDRAVIRGGYQQGAIAVDRRYHYLLGGLPTSGGAVEWFRAAVAAGADHATLIREAEVVAPGSGGVCFLPHLRLCSPPYPDRAARGSFFGLTADTSRGGLFRSVLEGLALTARAVVDGMVGLPGAAPIREVRVIGGSTQNALLLRIKASAFGRPLQVATFAETSCLGAAMFGGIGAGLFPHAAAARAAMARGAGSMRTVEPDPHWQARYDALYERVYRDAPMAFMPLNAALAELARQAAPSAPVSA